MESSRSSLFSTVIMTLPLVVVPAIALLQPPAPNSGASSTELGAAEEFDIFKDLEVFEFADEANAAAGRTSDNSPAQAEDEFDALFHEVGGDSPGRPHTPAPNSDSIPEYRRDDPFVPTQGHRGAAESSDPAAAARGSAISEQELPPAGRAAAPATDAEESRLLMQLQAQGVMRIHWFVPGTTGTTGRIGVAIFVPGDDPAVTYRFESVAVQRRDALVDVLLQLTRWQARAAEAARRP